MGEYGLKWIKKQNKKNLQPHEGTPLPIVG